MKLFLSAIVVGLMGLAPLLNFQQTVRSRTRLKIGGKSIGKSKSGPATKPSPVAETENLTAWERLQTMSASNNETGGDVSVLLSKLNYTQVTVVYHVGFGKRVGRTNNQLVSILHALDMAFDKHGELNADGSNCTVVLGVSGWARTALQRLFFDPTSNHYDEEWAMKLEQTVPIIDMERLHTLPALQKVVKIPAEIAYPYTKQNVNRVSPERIQRRRLLILGQLVRHISSSHLESYEILARYLEHKAATQGRQSGDQTSSSSTTGPRYLALHSRSLEGSCQNRVGRKLPNDECDMNPTYIKNILRARGLMGRRIPIVVITDLQNHATLDSLRNDLDIGSQVVVPALDIDGLSESSNPASDMMIAAMSDVFVGTRISSMAVMIGLFRAVLGKDPQTNYVYVDKELNVCGECIYFCNATQASICGKTAIYV